jgi:hypothetical protein
MNGYVEWIVWTQVPESGHGAPGFGSGFGLAGGGDEWFGLDVEDGYYGGD